MSSGNNGKLLTVSRKLAKILTVSRRSRHPIETLLKQGGSYDTPHLRRGYCKQESGIYVWP